MENKVMKLNLGCGTLLKEGWVNLDIRELPGVDVVRDVLRGLPFDDETFDFIHSNNFLEHLPPTEIIWFMNEMWRVMKVGGQMHHIVPKAGTPSDFQDPTHLAHWNFETVHYFVDKSFLNNYYQGTAKGWNLVRCNTSSFHGDLFEFILEKI